MVLESSSVALLVSVSVSSQASYSRAHEAEADEFAFHLMEPAGVVPHHFASILRKVHAATGAEENGVLDYLSTHPSAE